MSDTTTNRVLRAALSGLVLALFATTGEARSPVGVTTASDGDPLGKPPNANERILRIGIDVQANELVTTAARDRAHLVFLDGSSLTVGPNARVVIDRFVYDPASNSGDLAINASRGVFRLVGGRISKQKPIVITTPSSTIGVRGGITIVTVTPTETVASFVYGNSMTVTAGGQTQTATRAGSQVVTAAGGVPGMPSLLKQGGLGAALNQLEGAAANANNAPDQSAQRSGFSRQNSGQPANAGPNGPPNLSNNTLVNAISNASVETQQATRPGTAAFGPVPPATPNTPVTPQPTGGTGPSIPPPLPPTAVAVRHATHQPDPDRLCIGAGLRPAGPWRLSFDAREPAGQAGYGLDHDRRDHQPGQGNARAPRPGGFAAPLRRHPAARRHRRLGRHEQRVRR